ncbi:MAG: hypothetical protein HY699_13780 [Deltaproteobacteria bacterium]|nr:hypothetical protein [Deltaproteobacteria bacterium]
MIGVVPRSVPQRDRIAECCNLTYDVGLDAGCYKCGVYTLPRDFARLIDGVE